MQLDLQDCELCLAENAPVRISRAQGLTVRCTAGRVWITVTGEGADVFLAAGEAHRIGSNGLALIEAIGSGRVRLERTDEYSCPPGKALRPLYGRA